MPAQQRLVVSIAFSVAAFLAMPARGATFVVNSTADAVDADLRDGLCRTAGEVCTLRAAVQQANALPSFDTLELPAGTFTLSLAGAGEDAAATGDLDVLGNLNILGAGEEATVVDGLWLDRVFHSHPGGLDPTLLLQDLTVRAGAPPQPAADGGCFYVPETARLLLDRVTVRDCLSPQRGGAIFNAGSMEGVEVSLLENGDPTENSGRGGAVANIGAVAVVFFVDSELRGNRALNGGAIYTSAEFASPQSNEVHLQRTSVIGNSARQSGGGLHNDNLSDVRVDDSTISGNSAGGGGGLFNDNFGHVVIRGSTIAENHAESVGGGIADLHASDDFIEIRNSILAGNTAGSLGPDCNFRLTSQGGTLLGDTAGCEMTPGPGDQVGVDPELLPLAELASRVYAHLPKPTSPALDAVDLHCAGRDQRRIRRPQDGNNDGLARCDLGAIEIFLAELFADGFESGDLGAWSAAAVAILKTANNR